jgi:c-di-GMP-binding flagellar brake protein YcgR
MGSFERRRHVRYDVQLETEYTGSGSSGRIFSGIIKNISHSGMCLYVLDPVKAGQEISIKSGQKSYRKGIVVWLKETSDDFGIYKIGLRFLYGSMRP